MIKRLIFLLCMISVINTPSCTKKSDLINPLDPNVELKTPINVRVEHIAENYSIIKFNDPNYNPKYPDIRYQFIVERNDDSVFVVIHPTFVYSDTLVTVIDSTVFAGNTPYKYRVLALRGDIKSAYSSIATGFYEFGAPSNLNLTFPSEVFAKLIWTNTNSLANKIIIERSINGATYSLIDSVNVVISTKDIAGIYSSDTTYYFRIKYVSSINKSNYTQTSSRLLFPEPTNLQIASMTSSQVNIQWSNNNNTYATSIEIESRKNNSNFAVIKSLNTIVTNTIIYSAFDSSADYSFRIRSKSQYNTSIYSNVITINIPLPVVLNDPTNINTNSAIINWTQFNGSDFKQYEIHKSTTPGFIPNNATLLGTITDKTTLNYSVTALSAGTKYYFKIRVINLNGYFSDSNERNLSTIFVTTLSVQNKSSMLTGRSQYASGVIGSKMFVAGGHSYSSSQSLSSLEIYDTLTSTWTLGASLDTAREGAGGAVVDGKLYILGGNNGVNIFYAITLIYNPATNTWSKGAVMPTPRASFATAVANSKIYTFGGTSKQGLTPVVEEYDPLTNTWVNKSQLPTTRWITQAEELNGKIYVVGGSIVGGVTNVVEVYNPITNSWSSAPPIPKSLYGFAVAKVDGRLYVIGGQDGGGVESKTIYEFNPQTSIWEDKGDLSSGKIYCNGCTIGNNIFLPGGFCCGLQQLNSNVMITVVH